MIMLKWSGFIVLVSVILDIVLPTWVSAETLPEPFKIIPHPHQVELIGGAGLEFGDLIGIRLSGDLERPVMGPILSRVLETDQHGRGILSLRFSTDGLIPDSPEGYVLLISDSKVEIVSRGEAGLFYGCQTLEQLLEDARDTGIPIPACKIIDYPALSYRAVHFDVKHHLDHMNYYYDSIDRLARYKINAIIFEFEDKLRYKRQPLVGAPQAVSIDEMAALTSYASQRHIEISPLVQGLGHATFILKHEQYADLREMVNNRWAFCPLDAGTYQVLYDLYRDAIEATPGSRYLHVGGDEIGNIGLCPRCKATADRDGVFGLNLYWLKRVCEFAEAQGRIPIFWDDMPLKHAGVYKSTHSKSMTHEQAAEIWEKGEPILDKMLVQFPKNCIYMRWNYSMARQPGNIRALEWYRDRDLKAMIATAAQSGPAALFPFNDKGDKMSDRGIVAVQSFIQLAAEKGIDGMLCTAWDDRSLHMETYWRGWIASAEFSWSPEKRSLNEYEVAYFQREFGPETVDYTQIYSQLREAVVFWTGAFNPKGGRMDIDNALLELPGIAHWKPPQDESDSKRHIDFKNRLIDLPDFKVPGTWSQKYKDRLINAEKEVKRYGETSKKLAELSKITRRNRYHWEVFSAINDFQVTASHMLLALKKCDTSIKTQQKAGMKSVRTALEEFDYAWEKLQKVYAKTRFISYPDNYVNDRYYHFASQREDLSFLIQAEEMVHKMVREWLAANGG